MKVLVGLGGNIGDPPGAFRRALAGLESAGMTVESVSGCYRSKPVGPPQPEFWNQAAVVVARDGLLALLDACQLLERASGRDRRRERRWGPRRLDLDLLLAEDAVHRGPRLVLPHPLFHARAFALVPAAGIVPGWRHQMTGKTVAQLARDVLGADPGAVWEERTP
ncbi:MAG: 2-amino-4-hydroxy-6-hydroxymethyldihydropteridine diphosphokinase [Acidobacteria bacterium]|nr:2-amino-4-hydroxy-6-hydroxymethyldihydropteridine diphosphokinase [Acidobacteriota bacterium]